MRLNFYKFVTIGILLCSCSKSKEEAPLVLAGEYQTDNTIVAANPIMVYTKNGPVNNQQLIDGLIRRQGLTYRFSRTDVPVNYNAELNIIIDANNHARLIDKYNNGGTQYTSTFTASVTTQLPRYFVLANNDSATFLNGYTYGSQNQCTLLADKIKTVYPARNCKNLPPTTGFSQVCKFRPFRVITIRDGKLFLPYFTWLVKSNQQAASCTIAYVGETNTFNPAVINQLATGDTIVAQVREIALLKK